MFEFETSRLKCKWVVNLTWRCKWQFAPVTLKWFGFHLTDCSKSDISTCATSSNLQIFAIAAKMWPTTNNLQPLSIENWRDVSVVRVGTAPNFGVRSQITEIKCQHPSNEWDESSSNPLKGRGVCQPLWFFCFRFIEWCFSVFWRATSESTTLILIVSASTVEMMYHLSWTCGNQLAMFIKY